MCYPYKVLLLTMNKLVVYKLHRSLKYYLRKFTLTQNLPNKLDCLKLSFKRKEWARTFEICSIRV